MSFIKTGFPGKMAVDIATDDEKGVNVALLALERLRAQGVDLSQVKGLLMCVFMSANNNTMNIFEQASTAVVEKCHDDMFILAGLLTDGRMGNNIKIAALTLT